MLRCLGFVCLLIGAAAQAAEVPQMPAARPPARTILVNCNNGESIQAAVDANAAPVEIQISGICVENVLIRDKDVTLRGTQAPSLDGIRSAIAAIPALTVRGSVIAEITDLSFSNSAGLAMAIRGGASMTIVNCFFENNGTVGLRVDSGAFALGIGLTFTGNPNSNTNTSDAQFFCIACDFTGGGPAAVATRGAVASLNDCAVTGTTGIVADEAAAFVDFDCSIATQHPCSMTVTGSAAVATFSGTARLIGTGNFTGQLVADDRGTVRLDAALQRVGSASGIPNIADSLGEIIVAPQSLILDTVATRFARVLLLDGAALGGSLQCSSAGDAFLDRMVIRSPGTSVTGCEHVVVR